MGPSEVASLVDALDGLVGIVMTNVCVLSNPGVWPRPSICGSYSAFPSPQYGVTWSGTPLELRTMLPSLVVTVTALLYWAATTLAIEKLSSGGEVDEAAFSPHARREAPITAYPAMDDAESVLLGMSALRQLELVQRDGRLLLRQP